MFETLAKFLIRALLLLVLFIFLFTVGINTYLALSGIKEQVVLKAQEALGKKLYVGFVYFLPWSGLHIENITITNPTDPFIVRISSISFGTLSILHVCKNSEDWKGELRVKKILVNNRPILKKIVAGVSRKNDIFSIDPLIAKFFGGTLQGSFLFQKNDRLFFPHQGSFSFLNIPFKESLSETAFQKHVSTGLVQGSVRFTGMAGKPESLQGSGTVELLGAELKTADFFGTLSRLFPMEELQLLKLYEAKASYSFSLDTLRIDSAYLKSDNMALDAHGTVSSKGAVALDAQLVLRGKLANYMANVLPVNISSLIAQRGYCEIPFKIYGSMAHLQTNFSEKIFTQQIPNNVNGVLQQLLNKALK
ncbi:MAG: hypothetical protein ACOYK6_01100 [Chthoniobacterales bacterium]